MRPVLIFDLDGTLVDSKKDLTASVNYIRNQFDLPVLTEEEIAQMEDLNPRTPGEMQQREEEKKFLQGGDADAPPATPTHEHVH